MPTPYIPETITVHLGPPDSNAQNVTLTFPEYIENVASGEIYPTWPVESLKANIYAQISFALNKIYLEFYRSRGYDFDITNSTAVDQSFSPGRNVFENISELVYEIFDTYIRRENFTEPLAARFCNGTTSTCEGLSQWGTVDLANQGEIAIDILKT
ncbi:MAG: spore cortex-lytic protein, partial [Clostridia bacterium]|nr:spore cortex-lytic protein [Clostridia bacterium]